MWWTSSTINTSTTTTYTRLSAVVVGTSFLLALTGLQQQQPYMVYRYSYSAGYEREFSRAASLPAVLMFSSAMPRMTRRIISRSRVITATIAVCLHPFCHTTAAAAAVR